MKLIKQRVMAALHRVVAEAEVRVRDSVDKEVVIHKHVAIIANEVEVRRLVAACVRPHAHTLAPLVGQLRSQLSHIRTSLLVWACLLMCKIMSNS